MSTEWWSGFFQGVLAHWISVIIMMAVSTLIAWGKKKDWKWATPILYGIATFVFLGYILLGGFNFHSVSNMSVKNIESQIRESLESFGYQTGKSPEQNCEFRLTVADLNGTKLSISQLKNFPSLIIIGIGVHLSADTQQKFSNLSINEKRQFMRNLRAMLQNQGLDWGHLRADPLNIEISDSIEKDELQSIAQISKRVKICFLTYYTVTDIISSSLEKEDLPQKNKKMK